MGTLYVYVMMQLKLTAKNRCGKNLGGINPIDFKKNISIRIEKLYKMTIIIFSFFEKV